MLRIKNRVLNRKFFKRVKLIRLIKKRKRRTYFKFKNSIRIVNLLIKLRRLKGNKNTWRTPRFMKYKSTKKQFSGKQFSGKQFSGKQLSNNSINKKVDVKRF